MLAVGFYEETVFQGKGNSSITSDVFPNLKLSVEQIFDMFSRGES